MEPLYPTFMPYKLRSFYPGMKPLDVAIWEAYIRANPDAFDSCAYDVAVGSGTEMDTVVNAATGGDVNRLYQRKIDVVATRDNVVYIIEVKPRASTSAIGQVKGYVKLFQRDFKPQLPLVPIILTNMLLPEMEVLAKDEGVNLIVV